MKKLFVLLLVVLFAVSSCSWACKNITPERRAQASQTLHWLQSNYQPLLKILKVKEGADPKGAAIAAAVVVAVDLALNALGTMLESGCADEPALANAELAASAADNLVKNE